MFTHHLALRLGKSVREIGESMSNYELTVLWPLYFEYEARERAEMEKQ
jgi:hypothetical protein